jgi:hypothetical protein
LTKEILRMSLVEANNSSDFVGNAFTAVKPIFDKLNGNDRLKLLRSLGGLYGHRVLPGTGASQPVAGGPAVGRIPKGTPQPKSSKTPAQQKFQKKISLLNKEISAASRSAGKPLEATDDLIQRRQQLFRGLKESYDKGEDSQSEISPQGTLLAAQGGVTGKA